MTDSPEDREPRTEGPVAEADSAASGARDDPGPPWYSPAPTWMFARGVIAGLTLALASAGLAVAFSSGDDDGRKPSPAPASATTPAPSATTPPAPKPTPCDGSADALGAVRDGVSGLLDPCTGVLVPYTPTPLAPTETAPAAPTPTPTSAPRPAPPPTPTPAPSPTEHVHF